MYVSIAFGYVSWLTNNIMKRKRVVSAKKTSVRLYCFSPPVMIATFLIEITLALYVLARYHMNNVTRLVLVALSALALFQLSEYFVCGGFGADSATWSRIGYVAITALPPIGLHLLYVMSGAQSRKLVVAAYSTMAVCMAYFMLSPTAFAGHECTGNYVIFQIGTTTTRLYMLYYYGLLLMAMLVGYRWLTSTKFEKKVRQQITGLMVGYLVFLIPTGIASTVRPETRAGIPSIMCGFAVFFALILALYIVPRSTELREKINLPFLPK